ncbi:EamA-like transporter family protein [Aphanothece hegewaldii CCALA 016]|uniref:EamA-like transporter family protein n=1 Tax=Aphanothece hegewaldii CCALA 016 TaxID=2107694 RepID=A0A2T1M0H5_9CHRO|nr:EamA family transporter [Aphanothece hegewaldii]PSF38162.1 EamA-like transporter family protein [Aphanothece hegewaldii CCALA 016]
MSLQEFGLLLFSVLVSATGQFFLKVGALKLGKVTGNNLISHIFNILTVPELIAGLACYGLGAIAYILLLTRVKLSVAGPSASLIYIFSVLMGYFIFKESIPIYRLFGMGFIVCGVILVVWQK